MIPMTQTAPVAPAPKAVQTTQPGPKQGDGGFGKVYEARQDGTSKPVEDPDQQVAKADPAKKDTEADTADAADTPQTKTPEEQEDAVNPHPLNTGAEVTVDQAGFATGWGRVGQPPAPAPGPADMVVPEPVVHEGSQERPKPAGTVVPGYPDDRAHATETRISLDQTDPNLDAPAPHAATPAGNDAVGTVTIVARDTRPPGHADGKRSETVSRVAEPPISPGAAAEAPVEDLLSASIDASPVTGKDREQRHAAVPASPTAARMIETAAVQMVGAPEPVPARKTSISADFPRAVVETPDAPQPPVAATAPIPLVPQAQIMLNARAKLDAAITDDSFRTISEAVGTGAVSSDDAGAPVSDRIMLTPASARGFGAEMAQRAEAGNAVAQQLSAAVQKSGAGQFEISLSPAELGRVRISLDAQDGVMHVTIQADRGDTADLIRRNIDQLERNLRDLGYASLQFSFGDNRRGGQDAADISGRGDHSSTNQPATVEGAVSARPAIAPTTIVSGGLDLRF